MSTSENGIPSQEKREFSEMIARARTGEEKAVAELVDQYRNFLLLIANHRVDGRMQAKLGASDVVQESIVHAQMNFEQFTGDKEEEFKAWLRTILVNDIRKERRRFNTQKRQSDREINIQAESAIARSLYDGEMTPGTNALQNEKLQALDEAMSCLSSQQRLVIQLRNFDGLDFQQIGQEMCRSAEAARKLWARSIDTLTREMHRNSPEMMSGPSSPGTDHE